jgi:hypothetical protein
VIDVLSPGRLIQQKMIEQACQRLPALWPFSNWSIVCAGFTDYESIARLHATTGIQKMTWVYDGDEEDEDRVSHDSPYQSLVPLFDTVSNGVMLGVQATPQHRSIVWLNFEESLQVAHTQDLSWILRNVEEGSLVLITVEASYDVMLDDRARMMRSRLGDLMPNSVTNDDLDEWGIATQQSHALRQLANSIVYKRTGKPFRQLFDFQFMDGDKKKMTWGGIVDSLTVTSLIAQARFEDLEFTRDGTADALRIEALDFSSRERTRLLYAVANAGASRPTVPGISPQDVEAFASTYRWWIA